MQLIANSSNAQEAPRSRPAVSLQYRAEFDNADRRRKNAKIVIPIIASANGSQTLRMWRGCGQPRVDQSWYQGESQTERQGSP